MREVLAARRPDDAILGEEYGLQPGQSGLTWVLDPVDGTRAFLSGTPTWGVLIALSDASGPRLGVIDQPFIGERFIGGFGLAESTGPQSTGHHRLATRAHRPLEELAAQTRLTRYGLDCYAYALVAAGQIDLVVEAGLKPYDIQAPLALIEAAGGVVTDWQGGPAHDGGRVLAAANRTIHAAALDILSAAPENPPENP